MSNTACSGTRPRTSSSRIRACISIRLRLPAATQLASPIRLGFSRWHDPASSNLADVSHDPVDDGHGVWFHTVPRHQVWIMTNKRERRFSYGEWRWRKIRRIHLMRHPLCAICDRRGLIAAATVVDHIEPHRGDVNKFWTGGLQSLCDNCHSSIKQKLEKKKRPVQAIGFGGWPIPIE